MKTTTICALLAALAISTVAAMWSGYAGRALADSQIFNHTAMPIEQITANATDLPMQTYVAP